jgi:3-hydroxyisobutyrate dehydrogenase-like beta-hydroxyacid dehydrogenase
MRIAFLGLGQMGSAMAGHLLAAGHTVTVYNRTANKAQALVRKGAIEAKTPAAAVKDAEAVVTMLADDTAVEEVVLGLDGIATAMAPGAVHVSMSTISVSLSAGLAIEHATHHNRYVSAPVFGRPEAAAAAKLFVIAGGAEDAIRDVMPIFDAVGQRTYRVGTDPSIANLVKLAGNFMIIAAVEAMAEAFALVRKAGMDPLVYREIMTTSIFTAPLYLNYSDLVAREADMPSLFAATLSLKDVRLALAASDALRVPMPIGGTVRDAFITALARGYENRDMTVLGRIAAENAGINHRT